MIAPTKTTASPGDSIDPETLTLIAAVVDATIRAPHRIASIIPVAQREYAQRNLLAWSVEGRRHIFASHQTR